MPKFMAQLSATDRESLRQSRDLRDKAKANATLSDTIVAREEKTQQKNEAEVKQAIKDRGDLIKTQGNPCLECQAAALQKEAAEKADRKRKADDVFPGKQHHNNCGVEASGQIVKQAEVAGKRDPNPNANPKTEAERLAHGIQHGARDDAANPKKSGGTNPAKRQKIIEDQGVAMEPPKKTTMAALGQAIKDKKGVVVSLSGPALWGKPIVPGQQHGAHAIMVSDGEFDEAGNLTGVYVNDTGAAKPENQKGRFVPVADFEKACDAHPSGSQLNVTKEPIWP
jgi:hypothetical protein